MKQVKVKEMRIDKMRNYEGSKICFLIQPGKSSRLHAPELHTPNLDFFLPGTNRG